MKDREGLQEALVADLSRRVRGEVYADLPRRLIYATDASMYEEVPLAVLLPRGEEDLLAAVEVCRRLQVPITPRGAGTSLAGQAIGSGLVVDTSRYMDAILEVDVEGQNVRVQPGVVLEHLNRRMQPHGLQVGPDPASGNRATIGGMVATNATGARSIAYGMMVDHVEAVRVVLADGEVCTLAPCNAEGWAARARKKDAEGRIYRGLTELLRTRSGIIRRDTPRWWRRSGGYRLERFLDTEQPNLAWLICGSEGTLGLVTEITLRLVPLPRHRVLGVAHFTTRRRALEAVEAILETGPTAVELLDAVGLRRCREVPEYARMLTFLEGMPGGVLIVEYSGEVQGELLQRLEHLEAVVRREGGYHLTSVVTPEEMQRVWQVRRAALGLVMGVKGDRKPVAFMEDAAVPVEHLGAYIDEMEARIREVGTEAVIYAHASAGCLHVRPFINTKDPEDLRRMVTLARASMERVRAYGGNISSEHGDGYARSWLNPEFFGSELYETYLQTKRLFDPEGLMNPGKVVEGPPMTEHLRMGPSYRPRPVETFLDFSDELDFIHAVERCNGVGVCRKMRGGTMCPSFRVTRDEMHSTRGRANLLREAMAGQLPEGLQDEALKEALDLCIACKACKAECPSSVDMARLKMEWMHQYYRAHPPGLRDRLLGYYPLLLRALPAPLRGLMRPLRWKPVRSLLLRALQLHPERPLPVPVREDFRTWYGRRPRPRSGRQVVLLPDTFTQYHEPHILQAAYHVLVELGYSVVVPRPWFCCGRPMMSKGFLPAARRMARRTVEVLYPYAARGVPILGVEPSCLLSLKDEFRYLLPEDERVGVLAEQARLITSFLAEQALPPVSRPSDTPVYLHVHCHEKALVGPEPTAHMLRRAGCAVKVLDAGCCGMAGAFGYEAEHYTWSMRMGEEALFPALREAEAVFVATGFSCRHQIAHGVGQQALHPVELLWRHR